MKRFEVTIFNVWNPSEKEVLDIEANSQDEAERIAISGGIINIQNGWGVYDSVEINDDNDLGQIS
jgi:hypothetical protein